MTTREVMSASYGMPTMVGAPQIRKGYRVYPETDAGAADAPGVVTEMSRDGVVVRLTLADGRMLHYGYGDRVFASTPF